MRQQQFTQKQLENWRHYEAVRESGNWNMFDPRAMQASCLTKEAFLFVMQNYSPMKEAYEAEYGAQ